MESPAPGAMPPNAASADGRILARNTLWNAAATVWQGLALLALVPYIVHRVGLEQYGIWVVLTAVVSYFDLADVTGKIALGKFVAQYHAVGDRDSLASALDNGALFYALLIAAILAIGLAARAPLFASLQIPLARQNEAALVFGLALVAFCLSALGNIWSSVLAGLQRADVLAGVVSAATALRLGATIWVLESGWGLRGLALVEIVIAFASLLALMVCARKVYPLLRVRPWRFERAMMKRIAGFGAQLNMSSAAEIIQMQLDKVLLSRYMGVQFVAFYDLGTRLLRYARGFLLSMVAPLAPVAAHLTAQNQRARLASLARTGGKAMAFMAIGVFGALFLTAPKLLALWVGHDYPLAVATMRILCFGFAFNVLTGVGFFLANGAGRPEFQARTSGWQTVLNLVLSVILIRSLGFLGAPLATSLAMSAGALGFLASWGKSSDLPLGFFLRHAVAQPFCIAVIANCALWIAGEKWLVPTSRAMLGVCLLIEIVAFVALYVGLLKAVRFWTDEEKSALRRHLPARLGRWAGQL